MALNFSRSELCLLFSLLMLLWNAYLCRCVPCFSSIVVDNVYKYNNQQHVNFPHSGFINSFDGSFRTLTGMDETL